MKTRFLVALAGNPNSGKSTLFNRLTGARQHVGNYPGVTVEKKEGVLRHRGLELTLVDLPGAYGLSAATAEECVARRFVMDEQPDLVVHVVDASNLERNLYLGVQLMELGRPMLFAFNMSDLARANGIEFDLKQLSALLGAPIVPTVGSKGVGVDELADALVDTLQGRLPARPAAIHYGTEIEGALERIGAALRAAGGPVAADPQRVRWTALKLLENDAEVSAAFRAPALSAEVTAAQAHVQKIFGDVPEMIIADRRYGFISGACQESVRSSAEWRHTMSDRIDAVLTHPTIGMPIFLGMMYLVFYMTFTLGEAPMRGLEWLFGHLGAAVGGMWPEGSDSPLRSLLVAGVIGGVGGVVSFLPNIVLLFMAIAILEDSGYMARAAFIMDRLMHRIGLHGKSFIPLLIGFGCSVPAILATRTLESRRDRLTTMLIVPLISCGARLPIYALIIPAFFAPRWQAPMLWLIYLIGIGLAIACARLLRATLFRGEADPFVMELPPYRLPTLRGVLIHMWDRGGQYVRKAGTVILGISIVLWALTSFPRLPAERTQGLAPAEARAAELAHTVAGRIGHAIEPALKPMGFDWRVGTAMIGAFAAKEVFVAQLGIVFAVGDAEKEPTPLRGKLRAAYTPLAGFCMMLFMLVAAPCMATVAVTRRESGSWKWALLQLGGLTALGYVLTVLVYQAGRALGFGG